MSFNEILSSLLLDPYIMHLGNDQHQVSISPGGFCSFVLTISIAIAGCSQSGDGTSGGTVVKHDQATNVPAISDDLLNVNGIKFDLPWKLDAVEALEAVRPDGMTFENDNQALGLANGRITLNGIDYGPVERGDRVKLTKDGLVSVNGAERKPDEAK